MLLFEIKHFSEKYVDVYDEVGVENWIPEFCNVHTNLNICVLLNLQYNVNEYWELYDVKV